MCDGIDNNLKLYCRAPRHVLGRVGIIGRFYYLGTKFVARKDRSTFCAGHLFTSLSRRGISFIELELIWRTPFFTSKNECLRIYRGHQPNSGHLKLEKAYNRFTALFILAMVRTPLILGEQRSVNSINSFPAREREREREVHKIGRIRNFSLATFTAIPMDPSIIKTSTFYLH